MPESLPITVIIPAYNRADLVGRAIQSALAQRPLRPDQIIVVDDASTDNTVEVVQRIEGVDLIRHQVNRGEGGARNTAVQAARNDWVALLDSDDEWLPDHLNRLWEQRSSHVLVADAALTAGSDRPYIVGTARNQSQILRSPADLLFPDSPVPASGVLVRRDLIQDAGGFRLLPTAADLDMWIRVLERGTALCLPDVGYRYYLHDGQVSTDRTAMLAGFARVRDDYGQSSWWIPSLNDSLDARLWWERFGGAVRGRRVSELRGLLRGLVTRPGLWRPLLQLGTVRVSRRRRTSKLIALHDSR